MKAFTAIEIVFIIFILIVVVLVVIQMVTKYVTPQKINPYIENIQELAKKDYMRQYCDNLCSAVKTATNEGDKLQAMVNWCLRKITDRGKDYIDIIEDGISGFYVVAGYPYCEAGTYCFHFFTCDAGISLDIKECRRVLCEYFYRIEGDYSKATEAIKKVIDWGKCNVNTQLLEGKILLRNSARWWYDKYFNINNDFCSMILQGIEIDSEIECPQECQIDRTTEKCICPIHICNIAGIGKYANLECQPPSAGRNDCECIITN